MVIRNLLIGLVALWTFFACTSFVLPEGDVFHILDAMFVATGFCVVWTYYPGLTDMWRNRTARITAAHWLTVGVTANWIGGMIRLGRWYITEAEPATGNAAWAYNVGLWISITAGWLLIGAVAATDETWNVRRTVQLGIAFVVMSLVLHSINHIL